MIVTVFGIPRSGKTTLINKLVDKFGFDAIALRKKNIIEKKSMDFLGKHDGQGFSLSEMNFLLDCLEKELHEYEKKFEYVFLDSHVGYLLGKDNWVELRPERFHQIGDVFIYLKTPPEVIYDRMIKTQGIKDIYKYSIDDLQYYQQKELSRLEKILASVNKEIIVLNDIEKYAQNIVIYLNNLKGGKYGKEKKQNIQIFEE